MSKRIRVPAPAPRFFPSVIRSLGPRLVLTLAGCAALLLISGGGYLLSHATHTPGLTQPQPAKPLSPSPNLPTQVLGASTTTVSYSPPDQPANGAAATAAPPTPAVDAPAAAAASAPVVQPSFDITVDSAHVAAQATGSIYVPFTVVRHGNFTGAVQLEGIGVYPANGSTTLLPNPPAVQSITMLGPDHGAFVLLPLGLLTQSIQLTLYATSGPLTASTSFTYRPVL